MNKNTKPTQYTPTPAWDLVSKNTAILKEQYLGVLYLMALPTFLYLLGSILMGDLSKPITLPLTTEQTVGGVVSMIGIIWLAINLGPAMYFMLRAARGKTDNLGDYYQRGLKYSWRLLIYYFLFALIVAGGLLLFIVPGFIFFRRYFLGFYYLVDQDLRIGDAFKRSAADSVQFKRAIWGILGVEVTFALAAGFLSLIPVVGLILGQLVGFGCLFLPALRYVEIKQAIT